MDDSNESECEVCDVKPPSAADEYRSQLEACKESRLAMLLTFIEWEDDLILSKADHQNIYADVLRERKESK